MNTACWLANTTSDKEAGTCEDASGGDSFSNPSAVQSVEIVAYSKSDDLPATALRILLVEDSITIRTRLRQLLDETELPLTVKESGTVSESRVLFQSFTPDLVVLDLQLLDGTSFPLISEFKIQSSRTTLCVLTTFEAPEFRQRCLRLGADHFFSKAREFERLLEVVRFVAGQTENESKQTMPWNENFDPNE